MNSSKITPEKLESVKMCIAVGMPIRIIGRALQVSEAIIRKYAGVKIKELEEAGPRNTYKELRLVLFKLYAWSIADLIGIVTSFAVTEQEIEKMQKAIFDYLKLDRFVAYCEGVIGEITRHQEMTFEEGMPEGHKNFLRAILGEHRNLYAAESLPGKKFFEHALNCMHQNDKLMPDASDITSASRALKKVIDQELSIERKKIGPCIPKVFLESLITSLDTITEREKEVITLYFGLNGEEPLTLGEIAYKFDLVAERVRQIKEKSLRRLRYGRRLFGAVTESLKNGGSDIRDKPFETLYLLIVLFGKMNFEKIKLEDELKSISNAAFEMSECIAVNVKRDLIQPQTALNMIKVNPDVFKKIDPQGNAEEIMLKIGKKFLLSSVAELDLSVRLSNCFISPGIQYGWQIVSYSRSDFLKLRSFGKKSLQELEELVRTHGLKFGVEFSSQAKNYLIEETIGFKEAKKTNWI